MLFHSAAGLEGLLRDCLEVRGNSVKIVDAHKLREERLDALIYNALFQPEERVRYFLAWLIRQAASGHAIYPASLGALYAKQGRGQIPKLVIPAASLEAMTYAAGRAAFRAAKEVGCGALVFSLEGVDTPSPLDYATCLLAAAIREGYEGPLFLEADFLQAEPGKRENLQDRVEEALNTGFFNLLLDPRRLIDVTLPDPKAQVEAAYTLCAELASLMRRSEPEGVGSAIGIRFNCRGDADLVPRLRAFMEGFEPEFVSRAGHVPGIATFDLSIRGVADLDAAVDFAEVARREYYLPTGLSLEEEAATEEVLEAMLNLPFGQIHFGDWLEAKLAARPDLAALEQASQWWELQDQEQQALIDDLKDEWRGILQRLGAVDNIHLVVETVAIQQTELPRPKEGYHQDAETYYRDILDQLG